MAKEQLCNYTYGEMLVSPGYDVDFAIGTTYSVNPQALLIIPMALGLLSSNNEAAVQSPICLLEGIRRSANKFVLFCNKGERTYHQTANPIYPSWITVSMKYKALKSLNFYPTSIRKYGLSKRPTEKKKTTSKSKSSS